MRHLPSICIFAAVMSTLPAQTTSTVTVTDSNMIYRQTALPSATTNTWPSAELRAAGSSSTDALWSLWWYFRVAGDPQEYSFVNDPAPNAPTRQVTNPVITTTWPDVRGRGLFSAMLTEIVVSTGVDRGYVVASMNLTNLTNAPLQLDMFSISDLEAGGSSAPYFNNNVCWGNVRSQYAEVATNTPHGIEYYCPDADQVQVDVFGPSTPGTLPFILSNTTVDNLTGWNGTFGPADHNGAFQWQRTIPAQGTAAFTVYVALTSQRPLQTNFGTAGAGTPGLPTIGSSERAFVPPSAALTRSFDIEVRNALPFAPSLLVTGFAPSLLVVQGIPLLVDPNASVTLFLVTDAAGAANQTLQMPPWAALYGLGLHHQCVILDSGGPNALAAWTNRLSQAIGTW